ncbi:hypothetical protein ACO2Q8_16610 [Larkinella sp. VNQ87]|uniref:hypothetical protein n=1 Tax=Larkinella sp. VNQ87 TaxID=3400921 RepID=UPI003C125DB9
MNRILTFIRQDGRRFAWEMGLAFAIAGTAWAIGFFWNHRRLQACQDERLALIDQVRQEEKHRLAVEYGRKLAEKDLQLLAKEHELLELRKKAALDSADRLSLIDAMRAINQRYQRRN